MPFRLLHLPQHQGGIPKQMVNTQKLGVGSRFGIGLLCREHRIPQAPMIPVEELVQEPLAVRVTGPFELIPLGEKRRDGFFDSPP